MIVVIGSPRLRGSAPDAEAVGLAASIARAAAADGALVEFIGKIGDDPAGDALQLSLTRSHIGHVAMLRDPARATALASAPEDETIGADGSSDVLRADPSAPSAVGPLLDAADAGLALRYLPEITVIVAVHADPAVLGEAIAAAGWNDTALLVIVPPDSPSPNELPSTAVIVASDDDDESAVGEALGRYAAALDRGEPVEAAYATLVEAARA